MVACCHFFNQRKIGYQLQHRQTIRTTDFVHFIEYKTNLVRKGTMFEKKFLFFLFSIDMTSKLLHKSRHETYHQKEVNRGDLWMIFSWNSNKSISFSKLYGKISGLLLRRPNSCNFRLQQYFIRKGRLEHSNQKTQPTQLTEQSTKNFFFLLFAFL